MNIYAWIGLLGIIFFLGLPLLQKSQRTKENIYKFIKAIVIVFIIIALVVLMNIPFLFSYLIGLLLFILFDKKTYTKKRLIIYGAIVATLTIVAFVLFKPKPSHTLNYLTKNPEKTSLYVAHDNDTIITYHSDKPRPLASVVKIIIALEYAYQIDHGDISKEQMVPLATLNRYYIENTDGGAHEAWINYLEEENKIDTNEVALHEVAKGMITFSSNANTDYLIELLGVENINDRKSDLELTDHDGVYPLVGAILISQNFKKEMDNSDWMQQLKNISDKEYKHLALDYSEQMKNNETKNEFDLTINEQRIWSDRLPKAPAATYGKLLHMIASEQFPEEVSAMMRDLMEWPMEMYEDNKDLYKHFGAKGGSTAFVYNQAIYGETLDSQPFEIVLFMDDLSIWQSIMALIHTDAFIMEIIHNEDFLKKVEEEL